MTGFLPPWSNTEAQEQKKTEEKSSEDLMDPNQKFDSLNWPFMWNVPSPTDRSIQAKKTREDAILPERQNPGDAGLDLALPLNQRPVQLQPGDQKLLMLGFRIAIPHGTEGQIRPRSSMVLDRKLTVPNSPGTVDSGYRKEVGVILYNYGSDPQTVTGEDRIAQLVINEISTAPVIKSEIEDDGRGGGFGSTGK